MLEENLKIIKDAKLDIELIRRENEKMCRANEFKIGELNVTVGTTEELLEKELTESGEKKLECKLGYVSYRTMPDKWIYDDGAIDDIHTIYPEDEKRYIKITESLIKTNIKEDVLAGKIGLPSVRVFPQEPKFNYKIK